MRTKYREKKYECGDFLEVLIYPVFQKQSGRRAKAKPTSEVQKKNNALNAERQLTRLVHTNFTSGDYKLDLTYRTPPKDNDEAVKDIQNFIRRAKRYYAANGINEVKYIWVMEAGEKRGRLHFHLIITGGVDRTALEKLWGKGRANAYALQFDENGVADLTHYMVKKPLMYRRWSGSKNLRKPKESQNDNKFSKKKVKELFENPDSAGLFEQYYEGYYLSECKPYHNDINQGYYLFLRMRKKTASPPLAVRRKRG